MSLTSKRRYRLALVGTGGIARAHATACSYTDRAELAAVCDISPASLKRFTNQFDVRHTYTSLDEMLAQEEIDIAVICTWGAFHAQVGIQLAESRRVRAILCEKPFTQSAAEAEAFVASGRKNGILVTEAFKFRHHPMHLKAQEIIKQGGIGTLQTVRSTFCTNVPPERQHPAQNWRFNRSKGGGAIYDLACYNIHHARYIFGEEPQRVFAAQVSGIEVDAAAYIALVFAGGRTAQISVGFDSWASQYVEISGDTGMLYIERAWNNENQAVSLEHHTKQRMERFDFAPVHQFTLQLEHLCDCLDNGTPHRISPANSIAQMRILDAVAESMQSGQSVPLQTD